MEKKKITWTKRILTLMVAVAVLPTSSLVTVPVYAASKPMVVSKYMLAKGEKFTLNVYNEPDNAKISYSPLFPHKVGTMLSDSLSAYTLSYSFR